LTLPSYYKLCYRYCVSITFINANGVNTGANDGVNDDVNILGGDKDWMIKMTPGICPRVLFCALTFTAMLDYN